MFSTYPDRSEIPKQIQANVVISDNNLDLERPGTEVQ